LASAAKTVFLFLGVSLLCPLQSGAVSYILDVAGGWAAYHTAAAKGPPKPRQHRLSGKEPTTMAEFKYEITERIAVLSQSANGWERQLNMVSWNEREPKYDIRDWSPDGSKMGKGISLSHDEIAILKGILDEMEL